MSLVMAASVSTIAERAWEMYAMHTRVLGMMRLLTFENGDPLMR